MSTNLDQLAFRFFRLFARFEATLKERGFYRVENGRIVVDWDRFATEVVGKQFLAELGDKAEAAIYVLSEPPKRQGPNTEGKIVWIDVSADDKSAQALVGHIRRMRNNLYHGGKFNGTWFDPERSELLLAHGLTILEHYSKWIGH